jgi:hypothetical protein
MSFWTGTEWAPEQQAPVKRASRTRHAFEAILEGTLVALLIVGLLAGTTFAGKGRGGHAATVGGPQLTVNPDQVHAGDLFGVSGCGFDESQGSVVVTFTGGSWGSRLDGGCFAINGIPALSGDTLAAGTYTVTAFQNIGGRWRAITSSTVQVIAG